MGKYDKQPLYCKLAEIIEEKIETGAWKKGEKITSERELCEEYNMSRITVRNAIDELVRQGRLEKVQGKGTFVVGSSIIQNLGNVYSFSREMEKQGKISATRLVNKEVQKADRRVSKALGIDEGDLVVYIERLRCAENTPIMLEKTYFPKESYEFVLDIDLDKDPLYKTLDEKYGVNINRAIETFKACELNSYECKLLQCKAPQYGLLVKRTSYCDDRVVCCSSIVSKGDTFEFTVKLESK